MAGVVHYRNPHGLARIGILSDADDRFSVPTNAKPHKCRYRLVRVRRAAGRLRSAHGSWVGM